jgi:hypothetical protein
MRCWACLTRYDLHCEIAQCHDFGCWQYPTCHTPPGKSLYSSTLNTWKHAHKFNSWEPYTWGCAVKRGESIQLRTPGIILGSIWSKRLFTANLCSTTTAPQYSWLGDKALYFNIQAMLLASAGWYIKLTYSGSSRLIRKAVNLFAKCISSRFSRNIYIRNE